MLANDGGAIGELLHESLVFTAPDGTVTGREDELEAVAQGNVHLVELTESERSTRESGGRGRTVCLVETVVIDRGERIASWTQYERQWAIIDGSWQVVAGSATTVS